MRATTQRRPTSAPAAPVAPMAPLPATAPGATPSAPTVTIVQAASAPDPLPQVPVAPESRQRDENGRWRSKSDSKAPASPRSGAEPSRDGDNRAAMAMGDAADTLKGVASAVSTGSDGIDPSVQAVKELGGIVSPVAGILKPMGRMFGIGRKPEAVKAQRENVTWYRRIWNAVKGERGGKGGMGLMMTALLSMLGMLLAPIKALSKLVGLTGLLKGALSMMPGRSIMRARRADARNAAAQAATSRRRGAPGATPETQGRRAGQAGTVDAQGRRNAPASSPEARRAERPARKGALGKGLDLGKSLFGKGGGMLAKGGASLLRKIPVIGALFGGAMLASSVMASENPNATPEEKQSAKADKWGTVGGVAGGVVGATVGSLLGPIGTIVGGIIGDQIGSVMGGWLSTVDFESALATVTDSFDALTTGAMDLAGSAFDTVKSSWTDLMTSGAKVFSAMSDWAKETWKAATDAVMGVKDTVADKVQTAKDYVGDKATSVKNAGQNLLNKATGGSYTGGSNAHKDELIKAMDAGGITDPKSKAMLMANVDHESGGFTKNEENLNYSAKRLQEVFPKYYNTPEAARADANNPEAIANKVYGGRMGNKEAGDGYKFRGRGDIQLTGRDQYESMGKKLGIDLVNNPDLAKDPKISAQIAVQHWKSSGADKAAMAGDQDRARKLTNGGTNGLADVKSKYDGYLAQAQAGDLTPTRRADQGKVQAPDAANAALASTMATVKGAPAAGVMPIAARPPMAPVMPGVRPVGVLAPTAPAPTVGPLTAGIKPISAGTMMAPSYTPPAPEAAQMKIPPTPAVEKPLMTPSKAGAGPSVQMTVPLSQNLEDRQIAHVAAGGMGMG